VRLGYDHDASIGQIQVELDIGQKTVRQLGELVIVGTMVRQLAEDPSIYTFKFEAC